MTSFITVTANPAVDRVYAVRKFVPGEVSRAASVFEHAGGKGVNVARALSILAAGQGAQGRGGAALVRALGFAGGARGRRLAQLAAGEGIAADWIDISPAETRHAIIVLDAAMSDETVLNEPGVELKAAHGATMRELIRSTVSAAPPPCWLALCGSLPPGLPPDTTYVSWAEAARAAGAAGVLADCSDDALHGLLSTARPDVLKVNASEACSVFGRAMPHSLEEAAGLARRMRDHWNLPLVGLTLGERGAVLSSAKGEATAPVPRLPLDLGPRVSAVGSGDAFTAGLLWALGQDRDDLAAALRLATACGAANVLGATAGEFTGNQIQALLGIIQVGQVEY